MHSVRSEVYAARAKTQSSLMARNIYNAAARVSGDAASDEKGTSSPLLAGLRPMAEILDLKLRQVEFLPLTREARDSLESFGAGV